MACYSPLDGFRSRVVNESGKRSIVFDFREGFQDHPVTVPCGQCIGCRLERSRQWAMRCLHESSLYDDNCFITLTYDEENLPPFASLDKGAFPKFMKRLRKRFPNESIRYYHCGEYGDDKNRPHYHAILFNFDFWDKEVVPNDKPYPYWRSDALEEVWPFGKCEIGSVNFESAAYIADYVVEKVTGEHAEYFYSVVTEDGELAPIEAPYSTMSRRPGIGMEWYNQFRCEVYASDSVVVRGREMRPPRFYDEQMERQDPKAMRAIKRKRIQSTNYEEQRTSRLIARRAVLEAGIHINKERSR